MGLEGVDGGIILLDSHWMVNHYQNKAESFLGWLVMQPVEHRMRASEMTRRELEEFGVVSERLEDALRLSLDAMFPDDHVGIVYVVRLGESTLATPTEWHLHYHMVPRTVSMKQKSEGWEVWKCRERGVKPAPSSVEIEELMSSMRRQLERDRGRSAII
jgi:diadenosine tetraphosphate (Ap4A) HIT family hydrolase